MLGRRDDLRFLATLLVAVLLALCVGSAAYAAMADAEGKGCASTACDAQLACQPNASGQALPSAHHTPIAILSAAEGSTRPEATVAAVVVSPPDVVPERPVVPLAARSPPAAL
jgi:hypothetical protein